MSQEDFKELARTLLHKHGDTESIKAFIDAVTDDNYKISTDMHIAWLRTLEGGRLAQLFTSTPMPPLDARVRQLIEPELSSFNRRYSNEQIQAKTAELIAYKTNMDLSFLPKKTTTVKELKEGISLIQKNLDYIYETGVYICDPLDLIIERSKLESDLELNNRLNTGGRSTGLSPTEIIKLNLFRVKFHFFFPNLSIELTEDTIAHQLAENLIGHRLPRKINVLLDRFDPIKIFYGI